jgi:NAD(P)-dependent dehydrogenase (short-subunit alcohol dehydrogenase family)
VALRLDGTFYCCREAIRHMIDRGHGAIVNMGSIMGTSGGGGVPHYAIAKAGILRGLIWWDGCNWTWPHPRLRTPVVGALIVEVLQHTKGRWGVDQAREYAELIHDALVAIASDPQRGKARDAPSARFGTRVTNRPSRLIRRRPLASRRSA